jgi:hypothetical protein
VGFFDSFEDVESFVLDLYDLGISSDDVDLLHGQDGIDMIDLDGAKHSMVEKIKRLSQRFWDSGEWNFFQKADAELHDGHYLLMVNTKTDDKKDQVVDVFKKNHGHDLKYFSSMYVEHIT